MLIELKSIKVHHKLCEEPNAYTANIFVNGKLAGTARNSGQGGPDMYDFKDKALELEVEEFCKAMPPVKFKGGSTEMDLPMDLELFLAKIVEAHIRAKNDQLLLAQKKRWCKSGMVYYRLKGDKAGSYRGLSQHFSPTVAAELRALHGDKVEEIVNETVAAAVVTVGKVR